jgi:hypothetical protein
MLKPFTLVIHDAAIAANPSLAFIVSQSSKISKYPEAESWVDSTKEFLSTCA